MDFVFVSKDRTFVPLGRLAQPVQSVRLTRERS